jgi:hypothetical protein
MGSINLFVVLVLKLAIVLLATDASILLGTSASGLQDSTVYNDSEYKDFNLTDLVRFESESGSHRIGRQLKLLKKFNSPSQHQPQKRSHKLPAFPRIVSMYNLPSQRLEQKADRRAEYEEDNAGYAAVLG